MLNKKALAASVSAPPAVFVDDVFSTFLYTGNSSTQTITNGIDLAGEGGLVWMKGRTGTFAASSNTLFDTERGATKQLRSDSAEEQFTLSDTLTSFNNNGFSLGSDAIYEALNKSGTTYASWTFRKQPKFFDVVTYTGTGSARTIAHNLGSVPGMIIIKRTNSSANWPVYHRSLAATDYILLNGAGAAETGSLFWDSTRPTSTVFSVNDNGNVNGSGDTYVAYLFAHDAGGFGEAGTDNVISCGSYTGNGSGIGPVITLGYEPQYVLIKQSSASGQGWQILDTMRGIFTGFEDPRLIANTNAAEITNLAPIDLNATGFQPRTSDGAVNASGATYIYMAIRRPMKPPTSGTEVFSPVARAGTGANATVSSGFVTDAVIVGNRTSAASDSKFAVFDRFRSVTYVNTTKTDQEFGGATGIVQNNPWDVISGYKVGTGSSDGIISNASSNTYINYMFRRAPNFFDVVCYTGTADIAPQNVAHNLGVAPELIIVKSRSATRAWAVYAAPVGNTKYLVLNTTAAEATSGSYWNDTTPTSSVFTVGFANDTNLQGATFVAYLFASCDGVSKVGSYTGNGSSQTINCGFTAGARFVLIKRTDSTGDWVVLDTARGIVSGNDPFIQFNSTATEITNEDIVDPASSGFIVNSTTENINASGGTYIYLAIA
jgi:hypothetical protein